MKRLLGLGVVLLAITGVVRAEAIIDLRDPLRGISFYSIQISTDTLTDLQTGPGRFARDDLMTLGISALIFDENEVPDEYVLWLRHDGPARWLTDITTPPLRIAGDGVALTPVPLHVLRQPGDQAVGPFVEKLEFALTPEEVEVMLGSEGVVLQLATLLGSIEKPLTEADKASIRSFRAAAVEKHRAARSALAATQ